MTVHQRLLTIPARTAVRLVCLSGVREAGAAAERFRRTPGPDTLHEFRVAVRRLRSVVRAFRPLLDDTVTRRDRERLRDVLADTAPGRDVDVQVAWIARLLADDPVARAECERLVEPRTARRGKARARARVAAGRRFSALARQLERTLSSYTVRVDPAAPVPLESTRQALQDALRRASLELRERLAAVDRSASGEAPHRARIAAKRLRYLLEPFESELEGATDALLSLRALQALLGDLHDLDLLRSRIAAEGEPAEGTALYRLARRLHLRREELARQLAGAWLGAHAEALVARVDGLTAHLASAGGEVEIERKFLLRAFPELPSGHEVLEVEQGWFGTRYPERVRRTRGSSGERCHRAIKHGVGVSRIELEEEIDAHLFATLWPLTEGRRVRKVRYRVCEGELLWEIDRFSDRDLVLAEVELPAADHPIPIPPWLDPYLVREVTDEPGYVNLNLAR